MKEKDRFVIPTLIFSIAVVLAAIVLALTLKSIKADDQTINATGSAKQVITSDLGILSGSITAIGYTQKDAYQALQSQKPIVLAYLKRQGFNEPAVELLTVNTYPNYEYTDNGQVSRIVSYTASQTLKVSSKDVNKIKQMSLDISSLVEQGVQFSVFSPEYYYSKIADVKIEIQAEAAKDAMVRAKRIAESTGRKLGALKRARMGVIQITPENSNMVSDQGINDVSSIVKEVTSVVNADFSIH